MGAAVELSDYNTVELPFCNLPQAFFLSVSARRQTAAFSCCCHVLPLEDGQHFPHPRKYARTVELPEVLADSIIYSINNADTGKYIESPPGIYVKYLYI